MIPINFNGSEPFTKPSDWTDEQCGTLPARRVFDADMHCDKIVSFWQTTDRETEWLKDGNLVLKLEVFATRMVPVSLAILPPEPKTEDAEIIPNAKSLPAPKEKYSWEKIGEGRYTVIHKGAEQNPVETLIAQTDTAEKADFITKACNQFVY